MENNKQMIKLIIVLFFSTIFTFSFSLFGAKAYEKITGGNGGFSKGTTIGILDVSGKTANEAQTLLEEKYNDWIRDTSFQIQYGEKGAAFDLNQFHLDSKQTVDSIKDGQKNPVSISVGESQVKEQMQLLFPQIKSSDLDFIKLKTSLNEAASLFDSSTHSFNLYENFMAADRLKEEHTINVSKVMMNELPVELQMAIDRISKIEIPAESSFSLLDYTKKKNIEQEDSLNVLATGIYQAILPSDFKIIERNIGNTLPPYSKIGYEAKVNQDKQTDLIFENPNKSNYYLKLRIVDNQLHVELTGERLLYHYEIMTKGERRLKPKTIVQYSPLLSAGNTKILTKGKDGQIVKLYRNVYQGENLIKSELISEDYYPPVYQVEIHGLKDSVTQTTNTSQDINQATDNTTDTQTTSTSEINQNEDSSSDLWGKPNEQPK